MKAKKEIDAQMCEMEAPSIVVKPMAANPASEKLLRVAPFLADVPVLGLALQAYHPRLIVAVGLERLFAKGVAHGLLHLSIQPMLTGRYGLTGAMYQRLSSLYALGWSVNAFFTAFADTFALFGYTKRWYCVLCTLGGGVFALLYALLPAKESSAKPGAAFLFLTALFLANVDTFAQAIYSRRIRQNPAKGGVLVSWSWGATKFGAMLAGAVQGPLSDHNITNVGVYITGGVLFLLSLLFMFNVFDEKPNRICRMEDAEASYLLMQREVGTSPRTEEPLFEELGQGVVAPCEARNGADDDRPGFVEPKVDSVLWGAVELNMEVLTHNWLMVIYCIIMTAAVVVTTVVTILGTRWDLMYTCIAVTVVVCGSAFLTLPLVIAKTAVFCYLNSILYVSLPGVLNTFYVAKPSCLPDGPHFNYTFYNIMSSVVGNVCSIIGITLFAHLFQNCSFRSVMGASAFIIPIVSVFDLIIVQRWNMHIGIPDHAMYILGDAIIFETVDMLLRMPTMLLTARVAPRGSEAMVLALVGGITHLGQSASSAVGYILMDTLWPVKTKGTCDYKNAPWLIITGHMVCPLLIFPLSFLLLPSSRICATLDERGNEVEEVQVDVRRDETSSSSTSLLTTSSDTSYSDDARSGPVSSRRGLSPTKEALIRM